MAYVDGSSLADLGIFEHGGVPWGCRLLSTVAHAAWGGVEFARDRIIRLFTNLVPWAGRRVGVPHQRTWVAAFDCWARLVSVAVL